MNTIKRFLLLITVLLCIVIFTPVKETTFMIKAQNDIRHQINRWIDSDSNDDNTQLAIPKKQEFAINNIQMNMTRKDVEAQLGQHKRMTSSVYGTNWYTYYSNDYNQFLMVSYINNHVNALYTNQNLISSKSQIKYDTPKDVVRERYGSPIQVIKKGKVGFDVKSNEYDVFHKDHIYTTVFYDKHRDNGVKSLLQVSEKMENRLRYQYGRPSKLLAKSFELQNFDIVNAERKQHGLKTLDYSKDVSHTARKHSIDMVKHNYFDHVNEKKLSPFDRLKKDGIEFKAAGENLAYGQLNSIYAHEGLMNSLGHRKNILNTHFDYLGVGVYFNDRRQPFWTENYTS